MEICIYVCICIYIYMYIFIYDVVAVLGVWDQNVGNY